MSNVTFPLIELKEKCQKVSRTIPLSRNVPLLNELHIKMSLSTPIKNVEVFIRKGIKNLDVLY